MLKHTQAEGKRTGIEIDMNTGTGWPFGGPEVSIEDAATKAIFQTYEIEGGKEIEQDINVTDPKQQRQKRQTAMESACRQMESDRSLHRKNKAESETGSSGRRRLCDESSLKKGSKKLSFPL